MSIKNIHVAIYFYLEMVSQGSVMCSAGFHNPQHNSDGDLSAERCNRECLNDAECQIATYLDIKKCYLVKGYGEIDCDEEETNRPDVMETFTKSGLCIYVFLFLCCSLPSIYLVTRHSLVMFWFA